MQVAWASPEPAANPAAQRAVLPPRPRPQAAAAAFEAFPSYTFLHQRIKHLDLTNHSSSTMSSAAACRDAASARAKLDCRIHHAAPSAGAAALTHTVSGSPARCAAQRAAVNR